MAVSHTVAFLAATIGLQTFRSELLMEIITPHHVQQDYSPMQVWLNTATDQQPYHNVGSVVGLGTQEGTGYIELEVGEGTGDWWSTAYFNIGNRMGTSSLRDNL
jgi:hypothetical protein